MICKECKDLSCLPQLFLNIFLGLCEAERRNPFDLCYSITADAPLKSLFRLDAKPTTCPIQVRCTTYSAQRCIFTRSCPVANCSAAIFANLSTKYIVKKIKCHQTKSCRNPPFGRVQITYSASWSKIDFL